MKHIKSLIVLFLICSISVLAVNSEESVVINKIDSNEANKLINENKDNPDFVILDVRTPEEYSSGHIQNSVNINYQSENFKDELNKLDKQKTYIVHCRAGGRAAASVEIMKELEFENIYNLGGIVQWKEAGYEVTEPESK